MKVEIWSDIMCPFCYIGKRKFDKALAVFSNKHQIEIIWKSYQLSADLKTDTTISIHEFLAKHKGVSLEEAKQMNNYVTEMALKEGLVYNFDKTVVANSFSAHQFAHFAKHHDKQNEAEEALFKAYFTEGKNIDDLATLVQIGASIGLNKEALQDALENNKFQENVIADISEAHQLGLKGVPFFVFNRKYAISGAQDVQVFLETLEKSFSEWNVSNTGIEVIEGQSCSSDEECN